MGKNTIGGKKHKRGKIITLISKDHYKKKKIMSVMPK